MPKKASTVVTMKDYRPLSVRRPYTLTVSAINPACGDDTLRPREPRTNAVTLALPTGGPIAHSAVFPPDGNSIISAGRAQTVQIWHAVADGEGTNSVAQLQQSPVR